MARETPCFTDSYQLTVAVIFGCLRDPSPAAGVAAGQYQLQTRCASASRRQHCCSHRQYPRDSRPARLHLQARPPHTRAFQSPEPSPAVRQPQMLVVKFHWARAPSVFTCALRCVACCAIRHPGAASLSLLPAPDRPSAEAAQTPAVILRENAERAARLGRRDGETSKGPLQAGPRHQRKAGCGRSAVQCVVVVVVVNPGSAGPLPVRRLAERGDASRPPGCCSRCWPLSLGSSAT